MSDVDLLIRTDGEQRISNFLLWQAASAKLRFADALWPQFDKAKLKSPCTITPALSAIWERWVSS